jgi:DNA-binding winged helix-turn-helix (wHTH) protein
MEVLVVLADHGQAVVSRQTLEELVWGDAHVGYHALSRAIYEARKAMEEVSPGSDLLETIPRRGYRLKVAAVFTNPVSVPESHSLTRISPGIGRRIPVALVNVGILGFAMHAAGLHGTGIHYTFAAFTLGITTLAPSIRWPWMKREPAGAKGP